MPFLDQVLSDTAKEISAAKQQHDLRELKRMWRDAPPLRSFSSALSQGFGLIAEIKKRSPSGGEMRPENFAEAPAAYARSPIVKAVSVLTNATHFGMGIEELARLKRAVPHPILRKDFIIDEYQVFQARAFGADAILLMANILEAEAMRKLFDAAGEAGLDVLFEIHAESELRKIPSGAKIWGINSRNFKAADKWWGDRRAAAATSGRGADGPDPTVELETFSLIQRLPRSAIKIAESGVAPDKIPQIARLGFNAVLVGTSLLKSPQGVEETLREFERACVTACPETPAS
jgi:indole-3-glycerol phosphate synthase